jgi:hypothetical protein
MTQIINLPFRSLKYSSIGQATGPDDAAEDGVSGHTAGNTFNNDPENPNTGTFYMQTPSARGDAAIQLKIGSSQWEQWPGPQLNSTAAERWYVMGYNPSFFYQELPGNPLTVWGINKQTIGVDGMLSVGAYVNDPLHSLSSENSVSTWFPIDVPASQFSVDIAVRHGDPPETIESLSYVHVRLWMMDSWVSFYFYLSWGIEEQLGPNEFVVSPGTNVFDLADYGITTPGIVRNINIEVGAGAWLTSGYNDWVEYDLNYLDFS